MKTKSLLIGMAFLGSFATSHAAAVFALETKVNPANGHTYYWGSPGNFTEAESFAVSVGGHLVTINDTAENAWITSNFLTPHPGTNPYIGLVDPAENLASWTWLSGESVTYLNWASGEPNNAWEHYSNLFPVGDARAGQWNNTIPTDVYYSIIEVVPEPTSLSLFALAGVSYIWARRSRPNNDSPLQSRCL